MASTTYYERGDTFVDVDNKPAIVKRGNQLTFTDDFKAGGGYVLAPATANALGGVKIGNGVNVTSDGTISVTPYAPPAYSADEVNTGKKWIDGKDIYCKVLSINAEIGSVATIASNVDFIDVIVNAGAITTSTSAFTPILTYVDNGSLKALAIANFTAEYVYIEYTKPTPVEPENNTRTVKKSSVRKG